MHNEEDQIAVLDAKKSDPFARKYGPSLDSDLLDWIRLIVSLGPTEQNFDRLNTLAWYVFVERQGTAFGEPSRFAVGTTLSDFQEVVYTFNVFSTMGIPFGEWQSVVEILFYALTKMVDQNTFDLRSTDCMNAKKEAATLLERLAEQPEYGQRYCDLLNGAL